MFLRSFNVYFVFGYACFMCICLKTAIWLFLAFLGQGMAFLVKLTSLQPDSTTHSGCHVTMRTGEGMQNSGVRGGGGGCPPSWKIQGKLCFQGKLKLLKNS